MKLGKLGEFGLIDRLKKGAPKRTKGVLTGIGDDAAVLKGFGTKKILLTCDMSVEDVHFSLKTATPFEVGAKAVTTAISDIAAMGGVPRFCVVSLGCRDLPVRFFDSVYKGVKLACKKYGAVLVGGDTVKSSKVVLDVTVLGEAGPYGTALRSGAKVGDGIFVTGALGGSAAGLFLLQNRKIKIDGRSARELKKRHLVPQARVKESLALMKTKAVHAMMDISDGLASEVHHICQESKVGALLLEGVVPVFQPAVTLAKKARKSALDWAVNGGEEYELVFTASFGKVPKKIGQVPVSCIGRIIPARQGIRLMTSGLKNLPLKPKGYRHF